MSRTVPRELSFYRIVSISMTRNLRLFRLVTAKTLPVTTQVFLKHILSFHFLQPRTPKWKPFYPICVFSSFDCITLWTWNFKTRLQFVWISWVSPLLFIKRLHVLWTQKSIHEDDLREQHSHSDSVASLCLWIFFSPRDLVSHYYSLPLPSTDTFPDISFSSISWHQHNKRRNQIRSRSLRKYSCPSCGLCHVDKKVSFQRWVNFV